MSQPLARLEELRIRREDRTQPWLRFIAAGAVLTAVLIGLLVWWWLIRSPIAVVETASARSAANAAGDRTVLNASGYVTARREATVSSKVMGKVIELFVEEGVRVKAGDVLARLDDTNVRASLALAEAQAASARSARQETRVRVAEAERELRRQKALQTAKVSAESDFDRAEAAAQALAARLAQQEAEIAVADRSLAVWQQQLEDTIIRAPFSGIVTSKNAQPGEMISPMSSGGFTRTGICTIVDMGSLEIEVDVGEGYIQRVTPGQAVEATLDAYPSWKIPCRVTAIIPTADRSKSTVRVRVGFEQLDARILPQMSVKVAFREVEAAPVAAAGVWVPRRAVQSRNGRDSVLVFARGRIEQRAVRVAAAEGDQSLLNSGVTAGEKVVLDPPRELADGAKAKEAAR